MDGFEVLTGVEAAAKANVLVTVTGNRDAIAGEMFDVMGDGTIICNAGHFDVEINKDELIALAPERDEVRPHVERFTTNDGRKIYLLAEGRLVNLSAAEGHPAAVMDMSFANQALSVEHLAKHGASLDKRVYVVPSEIDAEIARLKLESLRVNIDTLSEPLERIEPTMKAMVLAAGLGTRLKPITFGIPKPMVPVIDRPAMAHLLTLVERHGFTDAVANLHYFPDTIRSYFGDGSAFGVNLEYNFEEELLGTAGGVRAVSETLTEGGEPFLIISGDALTDIDLTALVERHRSAGGVATLTVKRVADTREYGVVLHDSDGRITGFQEKPDPEEALSDLGNCGIYVFSPEIFDYFPETEFVDWAQDVFPVLLENDIPFYIHEIEEYWNDVGSLSELRSGTYDALTGALDLGIEGTGSPDGAFSGTPGALEAAELVEGPVWIGRDVEIGAGARLQGPLVIGDGARIGAGAAIRDSIVFPGGEVPAGTLAVGAILGQGDIVANLRPAADLTK
jgi:mannose-1-phosphate guanylyltransferase/mannose-1-phosphate guanylyltransferase/phosphomannomutase